MSLTDLLRNNVVLDEVTEEYVIENSKIIANEQVDLVTEPVSAKIGLRNDSLCYVIEEVSFDNDVVREVFRLEADDEIFSSVSSEIIQIPLDAGDFGERYVSIRNEIVESYCDNLSEETTVSEMDVEAMKTLVDRNNLQLGVFTGPFVDERVERVKIVGEECVVVIDGEEFDTNLSISGDELRSFIIQLAQRVGEHISAADRFVELDGSEIESGVFVQDVELLSLELPEESSIDDVTVVDVKFI